MVLPVIMVANVLYFMNSVMSDQPVRNAMAVARRLRPLTFVEAAVVAADAVVAVDMESLVEVLVVALLLVALLLVVARQAGDWNNNIVGGIVLLLLLLRLGDDSIDEYDNCPFDNPLLGTTNADTDKAVQEQIKRRHGKMRG